ncbi:FK506-binding protein 3 [Seminavis robusta]|uniref:peptidylprolyl isomerase n=1 Tax=Seminavis robusta TaxID=568900 RepID=A0A9N8DCF9_9STRA|nr:FK506-binding protein 3 [Seminavis robusta]|eukprot:Sro28_g018880.1 FK506-binding protein 3 (257) ;mRNA; f:153098-154029
MKNLDLSVSVAALAFAGLQLVLLNPVSSFPVVPSIQSHHGTTATKLPIRLATAMNNEDEVQFQELISRRSALASSGLRLSVLLGIASVPTPVSAKGLSEEYRQGTAALADMDESAPVPREAYKKLDSGVIYADLLKGKADAVVKAGSKVNLEWVLRKSNGYFVDSSQVVGSPFIFTVGDKTAIAGVDQGVQGMNIGGVRRLLIPPSLAYVDGLEDGKPGPMPQGFGPRQQMRRVQGVRKDVPGEYIYLEVQVTRVR